MEVRKGYKQTEVGLIPSDWEVSVLGNLLNGIADVDHYMPKTEKYGVPYVMTGDLKDYAGYIDFDSCKKISYDDYEKLSKKVRNFKGDIILARYATVGTVSFVNIDFDFVVSYSCVTIKPDKSRLIDLFLYYYFKSNIFRLEVKNKVNANIQDNVGIGDLVKMKIPLPPTKTEQIAIATALSDADALIASLEKLIEKKRAIKQGSMQELLKPKVGWEVKKLGEIAEVRDGTHQTPKYVESGIPFYSVETVTNNSFTNTKFITEEEHSFLTKTFRIEKGDILMTRIGSIGDCKLIDWDVNASFYVSLALLKIKDGVSASFICHYSKSSQFKKEVELNSLQSAIPRKINLGPISNIKIELPIIEEQTRIAILLSDMDAEITALEQKLAKYKQIKQGMMQELLTGRIRLVENV